MKYPEGWAQQGSGLNVILRSKNIACLVIVKGPAPTLGADPPGELGAPAAHESRAAPSR